MLPSLRGLGPRRLPTPGPGRRLAPGRLLPHWLASGRLASGWFASGRFASGRFASGRLLLHRLASHRPVPRRPHRRRRAALGAALALVALAAAFLPVAVGRPGEAVSAPASSIPASSAGFTYRTLPSPAQFAAAAGHAAAPIPSVAGDRAVQLQSPNPLSTAKCLATIKLRCYSPLQYRVAYDLNPLYAGGVTGKGQTIMIVDSFGSPAIRHDLAYFDRQWGLPDPTLNVFKLGKLPPFDKSSATMDGWAEEATLDVEYAHAVAPEAAIDLVETPVAETEGVTGFPQMMAAEKALIDRGGVDVISQSFGATEDTFPGFAKASYASLQSLRYAFKDAAQHDVTVLAAAGDTGATDDEPDGASLYPYAAVAWPSSDPLVTSVGGTQLLLAQDGNKIQPDQVWNDDYGAGGGGRSAVFSQPAFQKDVGPVVQGRRGTPDISMSAAVSGGAWVYQSFEPGGAGWEILGGTSEATPLFAGVVALASQQAGHPLGNIDTALYTLGQQSRTKADARQTGILDVTTGDNTFGDVTGSKAAPGYDLASGWGTVDAARFVPALARTVKLTP
jgi:subtilase family serine protease